MDEAQLIAGYQGIAQNWECDANDHLNVSHFFGRASDHSFFTRHALAMSPRQMVEDRRGTVALEEHARFHAEVRAGDLMIGRSAPVDIGEKTMSVYYELRTPAGALLTTFKTLIGCFDLDARKLVPWTDETLARTHALKIDLPSHAAPKFVDAGKPIAQISLADTKNDGFQRSGGNGVNSWECDQFGHMNTMFYIRRQTEAMPHFWRQVGMDMHADNNGFVVGEMRITYLQEAREGDMVEMWSALRAVGDKTALVEHRMYNVETGALSANTLTRTVYFDRQTRRACPWSDTVRARLQAACIG